MINKIVYAMNKVLLTLSFFCLSCFYGICQNNMSDVVERGLNRAVVQHKAMAYSLLDKKDRLPRTIDKNGNLHIVGPHDWTSGFYPGALWYLYEATRDDSLKFFAEEYTRRVENEQYTTDNHDVGFIIFCSYGNGYRLTGNEQYKKVILQAAKPLSTRYNDVTKTIRSWDFNKEEWQYPVIIDNMMNLELLLWSSRAGKNAEYGRIAKTHANTTMKNHFRPDFSSYHVVSYDTITGVPEKKQTSQGFSDESSWARGQAWGLYSFTMMYRETKDPRYLKQAENIAEFILNHPNLPDDKIPYWDFNAPDIPNDYRDASAGAIMASGFIELSTLTKNKKLGKRCLDTAERQLRTLTSKDYLAEPYTNRNFILMHSVGHKPVRSEVDVPLIYTDYYYVEALLRYKKWILKK